MYIDQLTATDFKSFASTGPLTFAHPRRARPATADDRPDPTPNVTVLIGENGTGKTSILKAICFGVLYDAAHLLNVSSHLGVRRLKDATGTHTATSAPTRAEIAIDLVGNPTLDEAEALHHAIEIRRLDGGLESITALLRSATRAGRANAHTTTGAAWQTLMAKDKDPAWFIVAYGADRQIELPENYDRALRSRSRRERALRLASLLDPGPFTLVPPSTWLAKSARRDEVLRLLAASLPDDGVRPTGAVEGNDLLFDNHGVHLPLSALSDGYRAFIGWVADLLHHLDACAPEGMALDAMEGVVLVDEIDLHLHPRWQQQVIDRVTATFPRLQFIVTTHSPLIIGGLRRQNVLHVTQTADGTSRVEPLAHEVWGRTPDQLLLDPIFGLEHIRDDDFMKLLRRVEEQALRGDADAARHLNALIAHGGGAAERTVEIPAWVRAAARERG